jgi:hemerythrin superfamily protein
VSMQAAVVSVSHLHRNIDAVTLLKADHRYIEDMFLELERTETPVQKQQLAVQICTALMVHKDIEQEIFYPAFLAGTQNRGLHHEAIVEHDEADRLISEIMDMSAEDEFFDAKIHVLSEMIAHHVREEERIGGMFSTARKSMMDLMTLGQAMQQRRSELLGAAPIER